MFKCSSCGACCRRVGSLMPNRADGACIHLSEDNKCNIYETRPDICRVDVMTKRHKNALNLSTIQYYKLNNALCNRWIKEDGMDDSYLINIEEYGTDTEKI